VICHHEKLLNNSFTTIWNDWRVIYQYSGDLSPWKAFCEIINGIQPKDPKNSKLQLHCCNNAKIANLSPFLRNWIKHGSGTNGNTRNFQAWPLLNLLLCVYFNPFSEHSWECQWHYKNWIKIGRAGKDTGYSFVSNKKMLTLKNSQYIRWMRLWYFLQKYRLRN